ncbi:MAG: glutaredoxin [Chloroflexi bacterium HGW-Chloroflexi-5]|jgi:glutaredoxin 3|nr:MAG: glutaredoxin [Deltaproteobacteria bacterium HGW-Deltaproteobacteria-12]PKN96890.1 MAG: glutaredoxin [Chloroflexi bacterium HGW-Chloroflexi-5]
MEGKILIYGTATCPFCVQARDAYKDRATFVDVEKDSEKLKEMLTLSGGKRQVPVIIDGDKVTVGFLGDTSLRGGIPLFGGT